MRSIASLLCLLGLLVVAQAQTTTYQVQLTGAQQLPPVSTSATANATLSFNADSNNITYNLVFNNIPEPTAAHIHINANPSMNGSVGVPLWMALFAPVPGAGPVNGLVASNTVTPSTFAGPLEMLPDFTNLPVSQLLSEIVMAGKAYVQVHTMAYPDGFVRGNIQSSDMISTPVTPVASPIATTSDSGAETAPSSAG